MNVTRENFVDVLPKILSDLSTASYVAMDFEMTGLNIQESDQMESIEERYAKMSTGAQYFSIVQCGLDIVHIDEKTKK